MLAYVDRDGRAALPADRDAQILPADAHPYAW
jgi:hypothetical protein